MNMLMVAFVFLMDRACPGRELANANMFLLMSMMLSVFNISKAVDSNGKEIEPKWEFGSGTVR
jgi:Cytochrome P450